MDFRSLTRRELQALCKKNKIHANITNVAMADALQALDLVEGIEDFLKPSEAETAISSVELPHKSDISSQSVPSTVRRTARRKTVKNETETSQSSTRTRNSTRRKLAGNEVETPIVPTVGRSAAAKEKQDVPKTPGAVLTSQKREAKEKSSVSQVYSIRRSARLAAKRLKESGKQDNERSDQTITFDNFSEAATEGLEVDFGRCSLHFEDEVEKAGIDLKTASDEGLDSKTAKDGALSFEFENLNLLNKELKVDMPKSSEELAASDNSNAIIENNVDMLLSNKLGEGEELNDDKAKELDSSLDVEPANFVLAENSTNNGLSDGKESRCDECLNVPDSYDVEVGLQDPHVLPVTPESSLGLVQEVANSDMVPKQSDGANEHNAKKISTCEAGDADFSPDGYSKSIGLSSGKETHCDDGENLPDLYDGEVGSDSSLQLGQVTVSDGMILPKQLKEPSTEKISVSEVEDADLQYKCATVSDAMGLSKQLHAPNTNICEVEDVDLQCKVREVVGKDDNIKHISDREVQGADIQCKGQQIVGNDMVHLDNEDDPNTEENDLQYKVQEVVGKDDNIKHSSDCDENKPNTGGLSYSEDEDATDTDSESLDGEGSLEKLSGDEKEPNNEDATDTNSESLDREEGSLEKLISDEKEPNNEGLSYSEDEDATDANSESLDGEGSLEELIGDEKEPNNEGLSYSEDEDATDTNSESLDGERSLEKLIGDEKEPNNEGLSYSEDEDAIDTKSESLDGERSLEKLTGDEKEPNNKGLPYSENEDATEARSASSGRKESLSEFAAGDIWQLNNEAKSKNIESSELLKDASETNMDTIGDKIPVQEQNSAGKEQSGLQNLVETPFVFMESSVPQVDPIGGTQLSALAFDHKQIPTGSAETNLGHTIQMISSTPVKKSSIKTPTKTPITLLSAGVKSVSDDKENVDNIGRKLVRIKENKKKNHEDCSPREITKSSANSKEATRPALQQLQENCLVDSSGNTVEV